MNWEPKSLDELGYVCRGRSRHRPRDAAHLYGGQYPFVQTGDVKHAGLYLSDYTQTYSDAGLAQSRMWPAGTLCITIAANIADTAILGIDACFPDSIIGFIPDDSKADARFTKYLFDALLQRRYKQFTQGAAQDNLSQAKLLSLKFPMPPITEQERIANVLAAYDEAIQNNHRRIRLLEEAARLLYKEWFVHLRFPGHEHVTITDDVPEGWDRHTLGEVLNDLESGGRPKGGAQDEGVPSIGAENVLGIGRYEYSKDKYVPEEYFNTMRKGIVQNRDVVVYKDGANIGRSSYFGDGFPYETCCVNEHVFILRAVKEVGQNLLYFWVERDETRQRIANLNANTAQPGVSQTKFKTLPFIKPPITVATLFNDTVEPMVKQIFLLARANHALTQARDFLLPRLMNGEVAV